MEKAQWSPINNTNPSNPEFSPAAKKQHHGQHQGHGLTRLPINFSNGTPLRAKKHHTKPPEHIIDRPPLTKTPTTSLNLSSSRSESRSSKPREPESVGSSPVNQNDTSTPTTTISRGQSTSTLESRVESKKKDEASLTRNPTSTPNSRAGTQTPKAAHQPAGAVATKSIQSPESVQTKSAKEIYQAFNIAPPENDVILSETQSKAAKSDKPSLVVQLKKTPGTRDTPTSFMNDSPHEQQMGESHAGHVKPVQDHQPVEIDAQSSSSSDDDDDDDAAAADLPPNTRSTVEKSHEEAETPIADDADDVAAANSLPEDHPIEWLAEAKSIYQYALPPFVTKQKQGVRRMVELPLTEGQRYPGMVEAVYRSWDAEHTFASIDKGGQRFIVKVFRGGATPYRPWLGPQTGFSETALAFAKQGPRGSRSWAATQDKRLALPKGWALKEDDENDEEYNPGNRRKSEQMQSRPKPNYKVNGEEEELDEDQDREEAHQLSASRQSERLSLDGDYAAPDPTGDGRAHSERSDTRPPSKLINALKKSLRLPKGQDAFARHTGRPKQIKRRSIGGQGAPTDSKAPKRKTHQAVFSSDSENPIPPKKPKGTKAMQRSLSTNSANLKSLVQSSQYNDPPLETHTLSPYKQAHTTLRIALFPYPQQSAVQRIRSCMTIATFFNTVIGVSGYKGDRDRIFGITATFDGKTDDDPERNMVIREEWQDSFDIFLETVDGAESWTEDGGKCSLSVGLLLAEV